MNRFEKGQRGFLTVFTLWLGVAGCMAVWIGAQIAVDRVRTTWPPTYPLLFLPNGRYLSAASLGFQVLLADTIYLWSIQYYGHRRTLEGRAYLEHIYNTITDLDPHFIDAYTVGALVMASDMSDPELAIELLDRGIERNPDEWRLPVEAGWYSYLDLEDYEAAERYYRRAAEIPGAPAWAARLSAHMVAQQGNLFAAFLEWEAIRQDAETRGDAQTAAIAEQRVYDLYSAYAIREIEAAIERFEGEQGRRPDSLTVLFRTGYLSSASTGAPGESVLITHEETGQPVNLNNQPFAYDPRTGEIVDPSAEQARTSR